MKNEQIVKELEELQTYLRSELWHIMRNDRRTYIDEKITQIIKTLAKS